ncbi:MAG: peptide chain release factor-like protein [Candidatus Rhabdochlamydia sp.]
MTDQAKWNQLSQRMQKLGIEEKDLIEKFIMGSGPGGQKLNKTSSCVYIKHRVMPFSVKCHHDRSREANRFLARQGLCERIETAILDSSNRLESMIEKKRRQERKRSQRSKKELLKIKNRRKGVKALRASPQYSDDN